MTESELSELPLDELELLYAKVVGGGAYKNGEFQYSVVGRENGRQEMVREIMEGKKKWQDFTVPEYDEYEPETVTIRSENMNHKRIKAQPQSETMRIWYSSYDGMGLSSAEVEEKPNTYIGNGTRYPKFDRYADEPIAYDFSTVKAKQSARLEKKIEEYQKALETLRAMEDD